MLPPFTSILDLVCTLSTRTEWLSAVQSNVVGRDDGGNVVETLEC
jgi:hypothetical protein